MSQRILLGTQTLNSAYQDINANFTELYAGAGEGGGNIGDATSLDGATVEMNSPIVDGSLLVYSTSTSSWTNQNIDYATTTYVQNSIASGDNVVKTMLLNHRLNQSVGGV